MEIMKHQSRSVNPAFGKKQKKSPNSGGGRWIMGKNCIQEVLKSSPLRILEVYTTRDDADFLQQLRELDVPVNIVEKDQLSKLVDSESHQSVVARVKEKPFLDVKEFLLSVEDKERSLVLMLDSIFDPQNFGSLLRSAECFGADAVIWSKNRGCDLTPVVSKTSVGASELMPLIKVSNLAETMKKFQKEGYTCVTAELNAKAKTVYDYEFSSKTLLVVGSEGRGVQPLISREADEQLYIPMYGQIGSLNVSQATAVLLFHWSRQWKTEKE